LSRHRQLSTANYSTLLVCWMLALPASKSFAQQTYDVVVYGGTAAGAISAISAAREGMKVALLEPGKHLGGMASSGLSATDFGKKQAIGGYALEFYERVAQRYNLDRYGVDAAWYYEPHVGEQVFDDMVKEASVQVFFDHRLQKTDGVTKAGARITEIRMENGARFQARIYIDSSYEGDLMAQAGVSYTWGRESSQQYGESLAGVRAQTPHNQWHVKVSPYNKDGKLLPGVSPDSPGLPGGKDRKVQAYNFRLCLTQNPADQIPFPKPDRYDPRQYELLAQMLQASVQKNGHAPRFGDLVRMVKLPNGKADANNNGAFSTDYIGRSWEYPEASYRRREEIWLEHENYTKGFFYFLAHDPRVPADLQEEVNTWGLAKDEFSDSSYWPPQLYVREARRMIGEYVMTQKDEQTDRRKLDAVGVGSYQNDSHNAYRYVTADGSAANEGDMQISVKPYQIPYRVLIPKRDEAINLLVAVCVSASHVAYSSIRMEPQYMIMGQAAGVAASIAIKEHETVQEIDADALAADLKRQGVAFEIEGP
jgi:hypothetical protein